MPCVSPSFRRISLNRLETKHFLVSVNCIINIKDNIKLTIAVRSLKHISTSLSEKNSCNWNSDDLNK